MRNVLARAGAVRALVRSGVAFLVVETLSSCTSLSPRR